MKIVINDCYGGFSLSNKAIKRYLELKGKECHFYKSKSVISVGEKNVYTKVDENDDSFISFCFTKNFGDSFNEPKWKDENGMLTKEYSDIWDYHFSDRDIDRYDKDLIKVIEELGKEASGKCADLKIVEISDYIEWHIDEYDGLESIHEEHRSWS